jgi:hypothetical protein
MVSVVGFEPTILLTPNEAEYQVILYAVEYFILTEDRQMVFCANGKWRDEGDLNPQSSA